MGYNSRYIKWIDGLEIGWDFLLPFHNQRKLKNMKTGIDHPDSEETKEVISFDLKPNLIISCDSCRPLGSRALLGDDNSEVSPI